MQRFVTHRNGFWLLLIASLAFNAGFGTTYGVRALGHRFDGAAAVRHPGPHGLHQRLGLNPQQRVDIEASGERLFAQMDEIRREMRLEHEALVGIITAAQTDHAALARHLEKVGAMRNRIQQHVVEHFLEVKELLGPEQIESFHRMIRRHVYHHDDPGLPHGRLRHGGPRHRGDR